MEPALRVCLSDSGPLFAHQRGRHMLRRAFTVHCRSEKPFKTLGFLLDTVVPEGWEEIVRHVELGSSCGVWWLRSGSALDHACTHCTRIIWHRTPAPGGTRAAPGCPFCRVCWRFAAPPETSQQAYETESVLSINAPARIHGSNVRLIYDA
jgi:hypothetical protein